MKYLERVLFLLTAVAILVMVLVLRAPDADAGERSPSAAVGMVTQLSGEVAYRNASDQKEDGQARALMKVHKDDVFRLQEGAVVRIVFFSSGRQETWKGPSTFITSEAEARAESNGDAPGVPEVKTLPLKVSQSLEDTVHLSQMNIGRSGHMTIRGGDTRKSLQPEPVESGEGAQEPKELLDARATYREMKTDKAGDPIPELYLASVLIEHERYSEARQIVEQLLREHPDNDFLRGIMTRIEQSSP